MIELPFPRTITKIKCSGATVKQILEQHLLVLPVTARYPSVSDNCQVVFDSSNEEMERVKSIKIDGKEVNDMVCIL